MSEKQKGRRGYYIDKKGYPTTRSNNKRIHTQIVEKKLGRKIKKSEVIHHRDGNKRNWRPSNLNVMSRSSHSRLHFLMRKREK